MQNGTPVWVVEGEAAEAAGALSEAGYRVVAGRGARPRPQFLVADMAHLGEDGAGFVREAVAALPEVTPILVHVWEKHLTQASLKAPRCHLLMDPIGPEGLLEELLDAQRRKKDDAASGTALRLVALDMPSIPELVQPLVAYVLRECREQGLPESLLGTAVPLCMTEALVNAVTHGNGEDPSRRVKLKAWLGEHRFRCSVADEGDGFDPSAVPLPTSEENLLREHGRGLFLVRHYMDEIFFNARGNCITMMKRV